MRLCSFKEWANEDLVYVNPNLVKMVQVNPSEPRQSTMIYFDGDDAVAVTGNVKDIAKALDASQRA